MVYGRGVKANMLSLIKLVDGLPLLPFKRVNNRRSLTFAGNLAAYIDRIIELKTQGVFIAMDAYSPSTEELIVSIAAALGKNTRLFSPGRLALNLGKHFFRGYYERLYLDEVLDNTKTLELLSITPPYSLEEGMADTISSYLQLKEK